MKFEKFKKELALHNAIGYHENIKINENNFYEIKNLPFITFLKEIGLGVFLMKA